MGRLIIPFLLLLLIAFIFHSWFLPGLLSTFDFPYYSSLMMKDASIIPYAWGFHVGLDGFAKFFSPYSWVFLSIYIPEVILGKYLGMDWSFIQRVMYLYPLLILLVLSPIYLFKALFPKNKFYFISVLVFSFNTYSLLLVSGEVFIALAYSLIPLVFALFVKVMNKIKDNEAISVNRLSIILGLVLAVQVLMDPRITYVTLAMLLLYFLFNFYNSISFKKIFYIFVVPGLLALLLHAFWLIPTILIGKNPVEALGESYSTAEAVKYLSFAKLEDTISLLHPNWPENIFGKTGFLKPEFLILPTIAFSSLLFVANSKLKTQNFKNNLTIEQSNNRTIIFFALLGLIGAFLAKGANDPFGGVYLWLFDNFPGFIMFRDPTKWYTLIALSYSILIPFSVWKIYEWIKSHSRFKTYDLRFMTKNRIVNIQNLFFLLLISYLLFLIRPAIFGQLGGMFKTTSVPKDYMKLEKFLYDQNNYFRTLWFPSKQKFGYYSSNHPEISAHILFNVTDNKSLLKKLAETKVEKLLNEISVRYIIVPYDSEKEIFLTDRKYDNKLYLETINQLKTVKWLRQIDGFGKIKVFEVRPPAGGPKDHFWTMSQDLGLKYRYISPVEYKLEVKNAKIGDKIIFSENYDASWIARDSETKFYDWPNLISSNPYSRIFNSFSLRKAGNYSLIVYYYPQILVNIGMIISGLTLLLILGVLIYLIKRKI